MEEIEEEKEYPRVLLIYINRINMADQHGISIRKWFSDWPKNNLAQIYSGGEVGNETFCGYNFKLNSNERRFGNLFFTIKSSSLGESSQQITLKENIANVEKVSFRKLLKNKLSNFLINTGIWELIFKPILSTEMRSFIQEFNPQIIYCQGYNLTFTWLPVMISKEFNIPICFQTGDDWLVSLYRKSSISFIVRPLVRRAINSLLINSSVKLSNGKLMSRVFYERYKMVFEPVMMCDSLIRFRNAIPKKLTGEEVISIVYSGNLTNDRWISFMELSKAAKGINLNGTKIMITIFASWIPPEAINNLKMLDNIQILPAPTHEELPSYLKGADILFLAEPFNPDKVRSIKLSISTKVHLYMFSEKPTLIYASLDSGTMDYANSEDWGCRVINEDVAKLSQALKLLITDEQYCHKLISRGFDIAIQNHEEAKVKSRFLNILLEAKEVKD